MAAALVSERERLDLVQQSSGIFATTQEWLEKAKASRSSPECKEQVMTLLEPFTVYGSLDAVTELYLKDDVKMALDFSKSRELAVLQSPTQQRALDRVSLRWSLLHSPSRLVATDQDFCYLEVTRPFETASGRRGWARCLHSVQHKACPTFRTSYGVDVHRAELLYSGLFFEETDELGVLKATVCYHIKRDHVTPVLIQRLLKAQSRRTIELVNHYLKMSTTMLKSRKVSLTRALQLHAERRCGACANQLSAWKPKERCVLCRSLMCDKCNDIVSRNYRIDRVAQGRVVCFSCAHRHGTKTALESETRSDDHRARDSRQQSTETAHEMMTAYQEDGPHEDSISSLSSDEILHSKCHDDEGNPLLVPAPKRSSRQQAEQQLKRRQQTLSRESDFLPLETLSLPTDHATARQQQRRRCSTRVSSRRPIVRRDKNVVTRSRSLTAMGGPSTRLSTRAQPTAYVPSRHKIPLPDDGHQRDKRTVHMTSSPVRSHVDAELSWQRNQCMNNAVVLRRLQRTDLAPRAATRRDVMIAVARPYDLYRQSSCKSYQPSLPERHCSSSTITSHLQLSSTRYSKAHPCDLSYVAAFR
ncbi:unnamed protein product [Hyaloperonospora brassicae]|uniref:FYVE-type domain-containing protein n=1 Tax=Hyaloperonospora brassicae TaxID=162125 RepID=A0AAV0T797_HYABA|nr:unnamed protein product [Hyaloperonospora brassicae]